MINERLMVFVDGNNLMKSAAQYANDLKIDYVKFKEFIKENRHLKRIYFFDALPDKNDENKFFKKTGFLDFLRHNGYTVKTKELKYRKIEEQKDSSVFYTKPFQKGVDVLLVCELVKMAIEDAFDVALLVSGDNDFASAIELVQDLGKNVEVASFKNALGHDLKQVGNRLITLDKFKGQFELESPQNKTKDLNTKE